MTKATYAINTKSTEFTTTSSLSAARVFVAKLRNGEEPSAYALVDCAAGVSVRKVYDWSFTINKMQKLLAAAAK